MRGKLGLHNIGLLVLTVICTLLCLQEANAEDKESKTVRVGYPIQEGLTMMDEGESYSGYTYEYLMEISQYTGWKYEIVLLEGSMSDQVADSLDMLKNGEIDLLGGLYYDESLANQISYPGYSYGTNYWGIFVPEDTSITETSLYTEKGMKIGVYHRASKPHSMLEQFIQMNGLDLEQVVTASYEEYKNMLKTGEVDAILSTDLAMQDHIGMHAVAHFSPSPFYFAASKEAAELTRELDYAMSTIHQVNPQFMNQMYNKYFSAYAETLHFTEEEKAFIQNSKTLEVLLYDDKPPFQYKESGSGKPKGITIEVLEEISSQTGLKFHYNFVSTNKEYQEAIAKGQVDILGDALLNYQNTSEISSILTLPWHELPIYLLLKDKANIAESKVCAVPYYLKNAVDLPENVQYYDTEEQCMRAVKNGLADSCYVSEYSSQFFFNKGLFDELKYFNQPDISAQKLSFGICNAENKYLLAILNKCITFLNADAVGEMIYRNTYQQELTFNAWVEANVEYIVIIILLILLLVFGTYTYVKIGKQGQIALENKRYDTISNLANEYFYEYNVREDELIVPEKCAEYFSCDTKIEKFSQQLTYIAKKDRTGIWQFGDYIMEIKEGNIEMSCQMQDLSRQWFRVISSVVSDKKRRIYAIGKISNIQDVKSEQIRLEEKASHDGLTGLYNAVTIKNMITNSLTNYELYAPSAVLIMDMDDFKQINDQFGHYNGDKILVQAAAHISKVFEKGLVGRLGGDEFIAFIRNTSEEELKNHCSTLCREVVESSSALLSKSFSMSIGIAMVHQNQTFEKLYQEADSALYQTKSETKNGFSFYRSEA